MNPVDSRYMLWLISINALLVALVTLGFPLSAIGIGLLVGEALAATYLFLRSPSE